MRWIVALIILVGVLARLPGLAAPPLAFHPTRQYRGAIIARTFYVDRVRGLTPQQRTAAVGALALLGPTEPPLLEHLAAWGYRLEGQEDLRVPRLISIVAWVLGTLALAWLLRQLFVTSIAIVTGVAIMMLLPFGFVATAAIQPDSIMTALTVFAVGVAVRYRTSIRSTAGWLALLVASGTVAVLVKPVAVFFFAAVVASAAVSRHGWVRGATLAAACSVVALIPIALYYRAVGRPDMDYGLFTELMGRSQYWRSWATVVHRAVGIPLVVMGLVGLVAVQKRWRPLLASWWAGYVIFGIVFAYRVSTHDYYSLPLIPIVAASVAGLTDAIVCRTRHPRLFGAAALAVVAALLAANAVTISAAGLLRPADDLRAQAARYERIGEAVGHSTRVVSLDGDYGVALSYGGWLVAGNWPLSIDRALDRLAGRTETTAEELLRVRNGDFFVATSQPELDGQPDLRAILDTRFPVVVRDGSPDRWNFVVYDLRNTRLSLRPARLSVFALADGTRSSHGRVALWSGDAVRWHVDIPPPALFDVRPSEGTGPATLEIAVRHATSELDRTIQVPIFANDSTSASTTLTVRTKVVAKAPGTPPYGSVDGPADPVVLDDGPVVFQGWALDDFDLRRVWAGYVGAAGQVTSVGDARFTWMRPDVAALKPDADDIYNDGWVLDVSPRSLPAVRPLVLHFYAANSDGQTAEIGRRTIVRKGSIP